MDKRMRDEVRREPRVYPPLTPGRYLEVEFLEPLGMTATDLASALAVPSQQIESLVAGDSRIDAQFAMRLARYVGSSNQYWLNLQNFYDLEVADDAFREQIEREIQPRVPPTPNEEGE